MYICDKRMDWYFVKYEHNNRKHIMCTKLRITVIQKSSYLTQSQFFKDPINRSSGLVHHIVNS